MDKCTKCDAPAKYFRRIGAELCFACERPRHLTVQGGDTNSWRAIGAMGGQLLATAKVGAAPPKVRPAA